MRLDARTAAAKEAERRSVKRDRVDLQRVNQALRDAKEPVDCAAAASLKVLNTAIEDAKARADSAAAAGRETFEQIIESVPDSMPELRALVERRDRSPRPGPGVHKLWLDRQSAHRRQLTAFVRLGRRFRQPRDGELLRTFQGREPLAPYRR